MIGRNTIHADQFIYSVMNKYSLMQPNTRWYLVTSYALWPEPTQDPDQWRANPNADLDLNPDLPTFTKSGGFGSVMGTITLSHYPLIIH